MKKKIFTSILLFLGLLLCSVVTCFAASTAESVAEAMAEQHGQEKYLESVHAPADNTEDNDHIDISTGNMVLSETDLYLPGKNGLDVTLSRNFNSMDTDYNYTYLPDNSTYAYSNMFIYKYYTDRGTETWLAFPSEEAFLETPEIIEYQDISADPYRFSSDNYGEVTGYIYGRLTKTNTDRTLTLKRPITGGKCYTRDYDREDLQTHWRRDTVDYETLSYNWYFNIPYTDHSQISSKAGGSGTIAYNDKVYLKLYDGENQDDIKYGIGYSKVNGHWQIDDIAIHRLYNNKYNYNLRLMTPDEETMLNEQVGGQVTIELCAVLERDDGVRYFLNRAHVESKIVLVADRFGNCINYATGGEIIDSMGRRIVYSSDGIKMEDENGVLQYVVKYTTEETADPSYPSFDCYKTYTFRVERFAHLGDTQTDDVTVYTMKKHGRPIRDETWTMFYYTIDQILYPTGAHRDYDYATVKTYEPYFGSVAISGATSCIRKKAISSKFYASNGTDYEYYYEYIYTKPNEGLFYHNSRKANMRYTTDKIRKAPNSANDIKTTYTYDYLGRIQTAESFKGTARIYPKITYTYPADSESPGDQPIQVKTDLENSVSKISQYEYYYRKSVPDKITENGLITSYSYDYAIGTIPRYFLLTEASYTPEGDTSAVKEISNTLTADRKSISETVVKDASGAIKEKTAFEYNPDGTVSKTKVYTDIANNVYNETAYSYTYNTDGSYSVTTSVNNVKNADGANAHAVSVTTVYDRFGNVASQTDANGVKTEYTYDLSGRVLSVKVLNSSGTQLSEKTYSYDVSGNMVDITRENGRQEKQQFDSFGNLKASQVNYEGGFKTVYEYTYDTFGRPATATENARLGADGTVEEKYVTTNVYDDRNRVVKQTTKNKAGTVVYEVSTEYGGASGKQYSTQWLSGSALYSAGKYKSEYDAFGRKTADVILNNTAEYSRTDYTYDCFGNVLTAKDDKARAENLPYSVSYAYDHAGRVLSETDVFGNAATYSYNDAGNLINIHEAAGKTVSYSYDALGRNTIAYDGSMFSKNYYDDNGNLVKTTESQTANASNGHATTMTYDDLNRMTKLVNSTSKTDLTSTTGIYEHYTYDIMGNVLSTAQDALGANKTTYTYDILGRNLSVTDPDGNAETYTYNFDGTLKTKTDKKGTVFTYSNYNVFKNAGKITAENGSQSQYLEFSYDMMNNLTYEYDSEGLDYGNHYSYDFLGRMTAKNGDINAYLSYTYDTLGNRTSMSIGENDQQGGTIDYCTQTYTYDSKSRLTESTAFDKTVEYSYNESDYLTFKQLGVVQTARNLNNRNLVTSDIILKNYGLTNEYIFDNNEYRYDYRGEQTFEIPGTTDVYNNMYYDLYYTYDGSGRLIQMNLTDTRAMRGIGEFYTFDDRTNITNILVRDYDRDDKSYTAVYPYTLSNHMLGTVFENKTGYLEEEKTAASDANGNRTTDRDATHTYDLFNRLTSYTKDGETTTYTYYASGLRESKTRDGVTTKFIWDGGNMVLEYRPDIWEYTHTYIYGADGLAYRRDADGTIYTYNTNFRGDVLSVMDENQNCMAEYVFDAYGNIFNQYNATGFSDNFGYRGEYHDPESGYIYLRMRYLDPTSGRFLTEDPAKDGLNWFCYCGGNPVKFSDPWGLEEVMLRYVTEKNYGTTLYDTASCSMEVTMFGQTHTFAGPLINGEMIVDSAVLADLFQMDEKNFWHNEGDKFDTADDAAMGFGLMYNPKSTKTSYNYPIGREYGAFIYDESSAEKRAYTFRNVTKGNQDSVQLPSPDKNRLLAAWVHTHGASSPQYESEKFSGCIVDFDTNGKKIENGDGVYTLLLGVDGYVITPSGSFKCLSKLWKKRDIEILPDNDPAVRIIANNLPH